MPEFPTYFGIYSMGMEDNTDNYILQKNTAPWCVCPHAVMLPSHFSGLVCERIHKSHLTAL